MKNSHPQVQEVQHVQQVQPAGQEPRAPDLSWWQVPRAPDLRDFFHLNQKFCVPYC